MTTTTCSPDVEKRISRIIGSIRNLPTPPIVFEQIQKTINDPNASVAKIAQILGEDPAMSVKVLKLTNSAFYGLSREVESVKHAVTIIGLEAVRNLVLSAAVLNMFKADDTNKEFHEEFWRHSLASAVAARLIAQTYNDGRTFNPDPAFTAGLVHDIGKMVICSFLQEEHNQIIEDQKNNPESSICMIEEKILGFNHAQMGNHLIVKWKLPSRMADAVGCHHQPGGGNESDNYDYLLCLSDYMAHLTFQAEDAAASKILPDNVKTFFNYNDESVEAIKGQLVVEYTKAETFMKMAGIS